MLSYTIAMQGDDINNSHYEYGALMSTTAKEFTENTYNAMTASGQYQQQPQAITRSGEGGARNK